MPSVFGIHAPNGEPGDWEAMLAMGVSHYTVLDLQADYCLLMRDQSPDGTILVRFYTPDWRGWRAEDWAFQCAHEYARERRCPRTGRTFTLAGIGCHVTPANEQNLPGEGGEWSWDQLEAIYHQMDAWNLTWLREFQRLTGCPTERTHWPAVAQGHSDDQDDLGYVGLDICRESINAYGILDVHQYWLPGRVLQFIGPDFAWLQGQAEPSNSQWPQMVYNGPWRFVLTHLLFPDKPIFISEAGQFDTRRADAPDEIVRWFRSLYASRYIRGATPFIFRDPTEAHPGNNWGAAPGIERAVTTAEKPDLATTPHDEEMPNMTEAEFERLCADIFRRAGVPYNPDSALVKHWKSQFRQGRYLGKPEGPEHPSESGRYALQEYSSAILVYDGQTGQTTERLPLA